MSEDRITGAAGTATGRAGTRTAGSAPRRRTGDGDAPARVSRPDRVTRDETGRAGRVSREDARVSRIDAGRPAGAGSRRDARPEIEDGLAVRGNLALRTSPRRDETPTPGLRVAPPAPVSVPRTPFMLLVIAVVVGGVLGILVLNTKINENQFELAHLQEQQVGLDRTQQQLEASIAEQASPNSLAAAARRLGLVPAGTPAFIRLPDGTVLGVPQPATGKPSVTGSQPTGAATGASNTGAQNTGAQNTGARTNGASDTGTQNNGAQNTGAPNSGGQTLPPIQDGTGQGVTGQNTAGR